MKRYIEIIFDNSYSMSAMIGKRLKNEMAKEIFGDSVLPLIKFSTDDVGFRLLRDGCEGKSPLKMMANKNELANTVLSVSNFDNNTPLYLTIKDSIDHCRKISNDYEDIHIFVLTDGEDNCYQTKEEVFSQSELEFIDKNVNMILVQFMVHDVTQANNLTAFSQFIGAKSFQVKYNNLKNNKQISSQLLKDLSKTALNNNYIIPHCYHSDNRSVIYTWEEIESKGYLRYWAGILFREGLIQWNPVERNSLREFEYREFKFLCAFRFVTDFPAELMNRMFLQLEAPYYYCLDEIYWDFTAAKWKYFQTIPKIVTVENPDKFNEINSFDSANAIGNNLLESQRFYEKRAYKVEQHYDEKGIYFTLTGTDLGEKMKQLSTGNKIQFNRENN
jgi:hypothetical protein